MPEIFWCTNCLSMSTRPRISFDNNGICNACQWSNKKKELDWSTRTEQLKSLLDTHRSATARYDCLVPVSGGKDGSYVAYNLKHKYCMNPLCVTVTPPMPLKLGEENLKAFVASGYNHITVNPYETSMKKLNKIGFIEMGFPYYGWLVSILAVPPLIAHQFGINLIFYGEDGEVEYGGSKESSNNPIYSIDYMKRIYLEGGYDNVLSKSGLSKSELAFFTFPEINPNESNQIKITHWSYYEAWDPYQNYLVAKKHCGLMESDTSNVGTFTNFSQNDQALYSLHTYLMYLKFGFGRANQDACIEIRRGAMDREQALQLVQLYDGAYPEHFQQLYLDYFEMTLSEFENVLDKWVNKELFEKIDNRWTPIFQLV